MQVTAFRLTHDSFWVAGVYLYDFARINIPDEYGADVVNGAAFRGDYPVAVDFTQTDRTHTQGFTHGEEFVFVIITSE
jgi:hypothetical protein